MLKKAGVRVMKILAEGPTSVGALAQKLGRSLSSVSETVAGLEMEGFVERKRRGVSTIVSAASTHHARVLCEMMARVPGGAYEPVLAGQKLLVLFTVLYEEKSAEQISAVTGMNLQVVRRHLRSLKNYHIFSKLRPRYLVARNAWDIMWNFLDAYRNYTNIPGRVVWKLGNELLIQTLEELDGAPGGFMAYGEHGVRYGSINYTWFLPKRKLSVEEIAVQGLKQVTDPRDLAVCITFMHKHRLTYNALLKLAIKYDCRAKLKDLFTVMWMRGRRYESEHLPAITEREIDETMGVYQVKRYVPKKSARSNA